METKKFKLNIIRFYGNVLEIYKGKQVGFGKV